MNGERGPQEDRVQVAAAKLQLRDSVPAGKRRAPQDVLAEAEWHLHRLRLRHPNFPVSDEVWRWSIAMWLAPYSGRAASAEWLADAA